MQMDILDSFLEWLDKRLNFERTPEKDALWLGSMEFLCDKLNHPEIFAPCIHIAGSKGKGSVSAMIASILDAVGFKTGLYTSPHLLRFSERVSLAHSPLGENTYAAAAATLRELVDSIPAEELPNKRELTWFELATIFAFLAFRNAGVDWSVFETGLGGRLDATNVVMPKISVITPIELEHTQFLGDTLEKIAFEKGGIIKKHIPVISARQSDEVKSVLRKICEEKETRIIFADEKANLGEIERKYEDGFMSVSIRGKAFPHGLKTRMRFLGRLQAENAALAALVVKNAIPKISPRAIEIGLSAAFLPARFEIVFLRKFGIKAILDGAHTENSARATMETFREIFGTAENSVLLFACAADKNVRKLAPIFKGFAKTFLTRPGDEKQSDLGEEQMAFSLAEINFEAERDFKKAFENAAAEAAKNKGQLLVTGSFYLAAEIKKLIEI